MGAFGRERREADPVLKTLRAAYDSLEREKQRRRELDAVGAYQFESSPIPGVGQGYAMPGAEGRAARHEARVRQGLDQGLSYEQAHRAAANTAQLEIPSDAMNYRNFQRDRMPGQMRTNAYRAIGDQGGRNADLASNLFGNIDAKGDLMGSRGQFYYDQEAGREAARQQVDASIKDAQNRMSDAGGTMPLYGGERTTGFTGRAAPAVNERSGSTVSYNPQTNTWTVAGGAEAKARAEQQRADRQATLDRRRLEIGEEMGLDGPANSMDVKIYNRRNRSDLLKQRNRAKFLARNPGRKYPGGTVSQAQPEQTGVPDDIGQLIIGPAATAIAEGQELNETQKQGIYDRARAYLGSEQASTGKGKLTDKQRNKFIDDMLIGGFISEKQANSLRTGEDIPGFWHGKGRAIANSVDMGLTVPGPKGNPTPIRPPM
jgi:hypothetical protein